LKRMGCPRLLWFAGLCCFAAYRGRRVPKNKVVDNIFIFNFVFYAFALKHFAAEIWGLSGLCCATPRMLVSRHATGISAIFQWRCSRRISPMGWKVAVYTNPLSINPLVTRTTFFTQFCWDFQKSFHLVILEFHFFCFSNFW
jgi:hypothetical protein